MAIYIDFNLKMSIIPANTKEKFCTSCVMRATWANDMDCSIMDGHTQNMQAIYMRPFYGLTERNNNNDNNKKTLRIAADRRAPQDRKP